MKVLIYSRWWPGYTVQQYLFWTNLALRQAKADIDNQVAAFVKRRVS